MRDGQFERGVVVYRVVEDTDHTCSCPIYLKVGDRSPLHYIDVAMDSYIDPDDPDQRDRELDHLAAEVQHKADGIVLALNAMPDEWFTSVITAELAASYNRGEMVCKCELCAAIALGDGIFPPRGWSHYGGDEDGLGQGYYCPMHCDVPEIYMVHKNDRRMDG